MTICKICKNTIGNKSYIVREMMFGYRDEFEYIECAKCGCLQIKEIPENLSKYYPEEYYSFKKKNYSKPNFLTAFRRYQRTKYYLYGKNILGMLLAFIGKKKPPNFIDWVKRAKIKLDSEILDIGCGFGNLLLSFHKVGFTNLTGIDTFINDNIFYEGGVKIFKKDISELKQQFDFIILEHSFEHISEPLFVLKEVYRILRPNRYALIRTPVVSSFAWRKYGVNWIQLDAPRHLFVHTVKSIQILADQAGFQEADIVFDSTELQFWGSEQYLKDIPYNDNKSYKENPQKSIFSKEQIKSFGDKAVELNKNNDGDQACFYLYKT